MFRLRSLSRHLPLCLPVATRTVALAAARLHLNGDHHRGQVLVIGDTVHDIDCGRSIGALCVAVPTGRTTAEALRLGEPDVLVDTLEDAGPILALLDN